LGEAQIAAQKLMLGSLSAIEQPQLRSLRQTQCHRRNIATPGGHAWTGSKKGDLHVL